METLRGELTPYLLTARKWQSWELKPSFCYFNLLSVLDLLTAPGPLIIACWAYVLGPSLVRGFRLCQLVGLL